jgi:hypothetical protein
MRIQTWMTAVTCSAMLAAAQTPCRGQIPFTEGGSVYSMDAPANPSYFSGFPVPPQAGYCAPYSTGGPADPNVLYPQGIPEGFQPWPQISPFDPANVGQTQHFNSDGLWFKRMLYRRRDYFANIGVTAVQFRNVGSAIIGSPYIPSNTDGSLAGPGVPVGFAGVPTGSTIGDDSNGYFVISNRILPLPALSTTAGEYVENPNTNLYPIWSTSILGSPSAVAGIQGELGFFNEDDTGVKLTGWGAMEAETTFQRGREYYNGIRINQNLINAIGGGLLTPMNGNIPLYNGEPLPGFPEVGNGSTAKYDVMYRLKMSTTAGGANLSLYQQPIYRNSGIKFRPMWGARYLYIDEAFGFRGIDSGFNYDLTADGTTGGGNNNNNNNNNNSGDPIYADTSSMVRLYDMYVATLNNKVESNLAGPEIGLRFDLGNSRSFNVWGESILGLMVNYEQIEMTGENIGDALTDVRFRGYLTPRFLADGVDSSFRNKSNSTHLSPTFQQSVFAEMDIIGVVPVLKRMAILDESTFRVGYTILWVGELARPGDSIKWQGYPLTPEIRRDRTSWWAQQFTASLNFNF